MNGLNYGTQGVGANQFGDIDHDAPKKGRLGQRVCTYISQVPSKMYEGCRSVIRSRIYKTCAAWFDFLSFIHDGFNPLKSEYYHFRAQRCDDKAARARKKSLLQYVAGSERWKGSSLNIPRVYSYKEFRANLAETKDLISKTRPIFEESYKNRGYTSKFSKNVVPIMAPTRGICAGMVFDLAKQVEVDGIDIKSLIGSLAKGGRLDAVKYQAIFSDIGSIDINRSMTTFINEVHEIIEKSCAGKRPSDYLKPYQNTRKEIVCGILESIDSEIVKMNSSEPWKPVDGGFEASLFSVTPVSDEDAKNAFLSLIKNVHAKGLQGHGNIFKPVPANKPKGAQGVDFHKLQDALIKEIDQIFAKKMQPALTDNERAVYLKQRTQLISEIKFAFAVKYKVDPILSQFCYLDAHYDYSKSIVADFFGMKAESTESVMGESASFADDKQYIKGIDKLDAGFYYISLRTERSGHAIALVKEADGKGYIFDPNSGVARFETDLQAQGMLYITVRRYDVPAGSLQLPKRPHHRLNMFKLTAKA